MTRTALVALCLSLLAAEASARIYKVVQPDGSVMFTNEPGAGGEPVNLRQTTIIPGLSSGRKSTPAYLVQSGDVHYAALAIVSPQEGYRLEDPAATLMVSLAALPALGANDEVRLLVDGEPWGVSGPILGFELADLAEGSHTLQAQVLAPSGEVKKASRTITVHIGPQASVALATPTEGAPQ